MQGLKLNHASKRDPLVFGKSLYQLHPECFGDDKIVLCIVYLSLTLRLILAQHQNT